MTSIQQDHIVLLVDTKSFENIPSWATDNFNVIPGGHHDGQASRNKLIIFEDGTYLELFNWYDKPPAMSDENLPMRFWGPKTPGLIDFAITDTTRSAEATVDAVNASLAQTPGGDGDLGIRFSSPVAGSRRKGDIEVKWKVTRPAFSKGKKTPGQELFANGRIDVPFFCHDISNRTLRVPSEDQAKTTHPCGAIGVAACEILVPKDLLDEYVTVYSKIIGSDPHAIPGQSSCFFDIGVPRGITRSKLVLRAAETENDKQRLRERGIGLFDLVIATKSGTSDGKNRRQLGSSGIESTIWLE